MIDGSGVCEAGGTQTHLGRELVAWLDEGWMSANARQLGDNRDRNVSFICPRVGPDLETEKAVRTGRTRDPIEESVRRR